MMRYAREAHGGRIDLATGAAISPSTTDLEAGEEATEGQEEAPPPAAPPPIPVPPASITTAPRPNVGALPRAVVPAAPH
jgi:hypothetical protein